MKHFVLLKLPFLLLGIGAVTLLAPACRAQSEVSPDHFDGTDSWAVAAQAVHPPTHKQATVKSSGQAQSQRNPQDSAFQLAAVRESSKPAHQDAAAVDRKRKASTGNREKQ